jgi:small subunit ribosomal protein S4
MAKNTGPDCKVCRREGEKLFLKGERCFTPKCAIERRAYAPGQHGRAAAQGGGGSRGKRGGSGRESDYGKQLRAKQKARRVYGVYERQFRRYYAMASKARGITGLMLLQILETRLDNVVFRLGYAVNRSQARLLVTHGHFTVNGHRTDVPSATIKVGDVIAVREGSRGTTYFKDLPPVAETRNVPSWLSRDLNSFSGNLLRLPERPEIDGNLTEQLIVEYYSR